MGIRTITSAKLGEVLVEKGLVDPSVVDEALKVQRELRKKGVRKRIGEILVERGYIDEKDLKEALGDLIRENILGEGGEWLYVLKRLREKIGEEDFDRAVEHRNRLGSHILEVLDVLGIMTYAEQVRFIYELFAPVVEKLYIKDVSDIIIKEGKRYALIDGEEVEVEVVWCPKVNESRPQVLVSIEDFEKLKRIEQKIAEKHLSTNVPFKEIVRDALEQGASDIHIVYKEDYYWVFFRLDGRLVVQDKYLFSAKEGMDFIREVKIEAAEFTKGKFNADEHRIAQDARVFYSDMGERGVNVRLEFIPDGTLKHTSLVARIQRRERFRKVSLVSLGYEKEDARVILEASKRGGGLYIVSGITGSGKSTLVASVVSQIEEERKVVTIEDPIEYILENRNVEQHQIYVPEDEKYKMDFLDYIKAFKRADPDVIFVGEIRRDPSLVDAIIESSQAGQLVFSTIHIKSAFDVYRAFWELFRVDYYTIANLIIFSLNQSLVPRLCECRKPSSSPEKLLRDFEARMKYFPYIFKEKPLEELKRAVKEGLILYEPGGCEKCRGTGFLSRVPVYEYFYPDPHFVEWAIKNEPSRFEIEKRVCEEGLGVNKLQIFLKKVLKGEVSLTYECYRNALL